MLFEIHEKYVFPSSKLKQEENGFKEKENGFKRDFFHIPQSRAVDACCYVNRNEQEDLSLLFNFLITESCDLRNKNL